MSYSRRRQTRSPLPRILFFVIICAGGYFLLRQQIDTHISELVPHTPTPIATVLVERSVVDTSLINVPPSEGIAAGNAQSTVNIPPPGATANAYLAAWHDRR